MSQYKPNHISLKVRLTCLFIMLVCIAYGIAELANGYTYIPAKRGGFFISGIPTLIIAIASFLFCIVAALTIIDHYDKRNNEKIYSMSKEAIFKTALYMFMGAPVVGILETVLLRNGIDIFPKFHGFAETFSYHTPGMQELLIYVTPFSDNALYIIGVSCGLVLIGESIVKWKNGKYKTLSSIFGCLGMIGIGVFILSTSFEELLLGTAGFGKDHSYSVTAIGEPAKFNAVLLTGFIIGGMFFISGCIALMGHLVKTMRGARREKNQSNDPFFK